MHSGLAALKAMNGVEFFRRGVGQAAVPVTHERHAQGTRENAFVSRHPVHAQTGSNAEDFLRYTAFRRPHSTRPHAENLFVEVEAALQLSASIIRLAKTILRKRQAWGGCGT